MPPSERGRRGAALLLLLAGCMVGPDYRAPRPDLPDAWRAAPATGGAPDERTDLATWWRAFGDPLLDRLVAAALAQNLDRARATARVRQARALRAATSAALLPSVSANATYQRQRPYSENSQVGSLLGLPSDALDADLYQAEFDASWEIDLFGGIRRGIEAVDADLAATVDELRDVEVVLIAEVARTYVDLRTLGLRLRIAQANLDSQRESVALTEDRFRTGLASELDVRQARSLLATTTAEVPNLERDREQAVHALGFLLGREPNALQDELHDPAGGATIPGAAAPDALAVRIPLGLPSDLLRRRPDVRAAERRVAAATARIGVATAELFPKLSLTGLVGLQSISAGDFLSGGSRYFSAGPSLRWRLFEGGRLRAEVAAQDAATEQALYAYEETVLGALRDVEDALVAYAKERTRHDALVDAVAQDRRSVVLSRDLYVHGLGDYLAVLIAERSRYASEDALARSDRALVVDLIATYKALGGGWRHGLADCPDGGTCPAREQPGQG